MTADQAVDAMCKVFLDAWVAAGYSADNVRWTDVAGQSIPVAGVWARVTVKHFSGHKRTLGETGYESQGVVAVQCFAPVGEGSTKAYPVAQSVVNAFRNSRNIDVWFRNVRLNEVGTSGAFQQINVLADFTYD